MGVALGFHMMGVWCGAHAATKDMKKQTNLQDGDIGADPHMVPNRDGLSDAAVS